MNDTWSRSQTAYVRGCAFSGRHLLTASEFSKRVAQQRNFRSFVSLLRELTGFFSIARVAQDSVLLAVDHVRSLPLFYGIHGTDVFVSDDAYWIQEQIGDKSVDKLSATEFLLTRFVSGSDTLSPFVKQIQAGEAIALTRTSEGIRKDSARFYEFGYVEPATEPFEQLIIESDAHLTAAFNRLIEYADGRTIVVPLGGGLDARLIVLMLKRAGYGNVVCFTYGRPGNWNSKISRKVALELGVPWKFIPYSNQAWRRWYESKEWEAYARFASNLSSTPHIQDWPAVWVMKERQLIPDDSIFVPGHMPIPSDNSHHLPLEWLRADRIGVEELAIKICDEYCTLQDWSREKTIIQPKLIGRIKKVLQSPTTLTPEQAIGYFDRWWWEGSETKFIINSLRVYEFWGYQWWLPLWDVEFARFWRTLPFHFRFKRQFQTAYIRRIESSITGKTAIPHTSRYDPGPILLGILKKLRIHNSARRIRARLEYDRHPYAWYGLIPRADYNRVFHGQEDINTYLANQTLKSIFPDWTSIP